MSGGVNRVGVITIDGPAASGKSSVARLLAHELGVPFVSSGLLYRAATFVALESESGTSAASGLLSQLENRRVALVPEVSGNRLLIDGRDVTARLHTDEVDDEVSIVASQPAVRAWVNERLREIEPPFVVEGRDMGTVVFPEAAHKFYLTAPASVRAQRRLGERRADLRSVSAALQRRDEQDAGRLQRAQDARAIETGGLGLQEVVDEILRTIPGSSAG